MEHLKIVLQLLEQINFSNASSTAFMAQKKTRRLAPLSAESRRDLCWIASLEPHQCHSPMWSPQIENYTMAVSTNASNTGWGLHFHGLPPPSPSILSISCDGRTSPLRWLMSGKKITRYLALFFPCCARFSFRPTSVLFEYFRSSSRRRTTSSPTQRLDPSTCRIGVGRTPFRTALSPMLDFIHV